MGLLTLAVILFCIRSRSEIQSMIQSMIVCHSPLLQTPGPGSGDTFNDIFCILCLSRLHHDTCGVHAVLCRVTRE